MAEYIKFRLAAAKVGVSMALLALISGVAERAKAASPHATASPASAQGFLKIKGLSSAIGSDFLKIEQKIYKLNSSLSGFESKLLKFEKVLSNNYYSAQKADRTFLKIDKANAEFLKITDANAQFLKITDANNRFVQGRGGVISATGALGNQSPVGTFSPMMGDGSVRVLIGLLRNDTGALVPAVQLENDTNASINFTFNGDGTLAPGSTTTLGPHGSGQDTAALLPAVQKPDSPGGQLDIQLFGGGGGAGRVWTVTVSTVPGGAGGNSFVGQMLIGLL